MFFKAKTKEEKILEEMKKKKEQIDKLKEDMNNMAKLVLKDGKLQKVEEKRDIPVQAKQAEMVPPPMPPPQIDTRQDSERIAYQQDIQRQRQQQEQMLYQQEMQRQQQEQMLYEQEMQRQRQMPMQHSPPQYAPQQQYAPQPQYAQQYVPPQPRVPVRVEIELTNGNIIKINIPDDKVITFLKDLDEAIDGQSVFPINNQVINGRNVVSYTVQ